MTNRNNANRYVYQGIDKITYHAVNHGYDIFTRWSGWYYYFIEATPCDGDCGYNEFPYRLWPNDRSKLEMERK